MLHAATAFQLFILLTTLLNVDLLCALLGVEQMKL